MTNEIWSDILTSLDAEMIEQNRKIILFIDNAGCHKITKSLKNITVEFLPAHTTALIQPIDQGIVRCFKSYYRQIIIRKQISAIEEGKSLKEFTTSISILDALHFIKRAWWLVKPNSIINCFKKASKIHVCTFIHKYV